MLWVHLQIALMSAVAVMLMVQMSRLGHAAWMTPHSIGTYLPFHRRHRRHHRRPVTCKDGVCMEGFCTLVNGCASTPSFPSNYPIGQTCKLTNVPTVPLVIHAFETESGYDKLTLNGVEYSGTTPPTSGTISDGTILWISDQSVTNMGWRFCWNPTPQPHPPYPSPSPPDSVHPSAHMALALSILGTSCNGLTAAGCNTVQLPGCQMRSSNFGGCSGGPGRAALRVRDSDVHLVNSEELWSASTRNFEGSASKVTSSTADSFGISGSLPLPSVTFTASVAHKTFSQQMHSSTGTVSTAQASVGKQVFTAAL